MSCSEIQCAASTANVINRILTVTIGTTTYPVNFNYLLFIRNLRCATNKFISITGNLRPEIENQLNNIINETGSATEQVILIVSAGLFILLFLLVLTIFAAIYWRDIPYAIPLLLFLAIFFIIVVAVVIYLWVSSIYNTTSSNIGLYLTNLNDLLKLVNSAILPSVCCFGENNCSTLGKPCQCQTPT